jgi:endonuclease/exonuclease/phosphatase family metal-dependent hydrolase
MERLRVVTLNIWNRLGPWDERLPLIRKGLRELQADVIGLQEVIESDGTTQAHAVGDGLLEGGASYHVAFGAASDWGGGVRFGNAVLSRWPILATKVLPLPSGGTSETRSMLLTFLDSPHGRLPFATTHLNWKFHEGHVREQQVLAVADHIHREVPDMTALPPVLLGDFNCEPDGAEIRFLKGLQSLHGKSTFFDDTFAHTGEGPGFTYDERNNPYAAMHHEYPRRIDYIFVRGPNEKVQGKPLTSRVVLDRVEEGVAPSDHFGVYSEISI